MGKYRKGVGIFLLNKQNKLWVGKRIDFKNNYWQMPQGGIDDGETPKQAMVRELAEEVGIKKNYKILNETEDWYSYNLPSELVNVIWKGKYVGQKQKWFLCKFFGNDMEIKLDAHTPEFEDWKWIEPGQAMNNVIPFKKELYANILESFKQYYC